MADIYRAAWEDLVERLAKARKVLGEERTELVDVGGHSQETARLAGKRQGIELVQDYMRGYGLTQPACGNTAPHRPHNGFATSNPDPVADYISDFNKAEQAREVDELRKQIAKLENDRDTLRADLSHLRHWCQRQRDGEEQAILNLAKKGEMSGVVGAAGRMKAYSTVLDEMARLERS